MTKFTMFIKFRMVTKFIKFTRFTKFLKFSTLRELIRRRHQTFGSWHRTQFGQDDTDVGIKRLVPGIKISMSEMTKFAKTKKDLPSPTTLPTPLLSVAE